MSNLSKPGSNKGILFLEPVSLQRNVVFFFFEIFFVAKRGLKALTDKDLGAQVLQTDFPEITFKIENWLKGELSGRLGSLKWLFR